MGRFCSHLAKVDESLRAHCSSFRTISVRPLDLFLMRLAITRTAVGFSPTLGEAPQHPHLAQDSSSVNYHYVFIVLAPFA